jgi:hypothetical protein
LPSTGFRRIDRVKAIKVGAWPCRTRTAPGSHGVLDIGATIALIPGPWVFGFDGHDLATWFSVGVGIAGLGATLLTRFESNLEPAMRPARAQPAL